MGKITTGAAISGLGEGIAKRGEEAAQTAREIRLQELRNSGQLESQKQSGVDAMGRQVKSGEDAAAREAAARDAEYFGKHGKTQEQMAQEGGSVAGKRAHELEVAGVQAAGRRNANYGEDDSGTMTIPGYIDQANQTLVPEKRISWRTKKDKDGNVTGQETQDETNGKWVPVQFYINKGSMPPQEDRLYKNPHEIDKYLKHFPMPWWFPDIYPDLAPELEPQASNLPGPGADAAAAPKEGGLLSQAAGGLTGARSYGNPSPAPG